MAALLRVQSLMAARRNPVWIWFLACAAWLLDGAVNLYFHAWLHARLALTISLMFLAAGLFFSQQRR